MVKFGAATTIENCLVSVLSIQWIKVVDCQYALVKNQDKGSYYIAEYRSHGWSGNGREGWSVDPRPQISMIGRSHKTGKDALDAFLTINKANIKR